MKEYPDRTAYFINATEAQEINKSKKLLSFKWQDNIKTFNYQDGTIMLTINNNEGEEIWIELRKE